MAEQSGKTPQTIIKNISQSKIWARFGKIRTKDFGYASTNSDFMIFSNMDCQKETTKII